MSTVGFTSIVVIFVCENHITLLILTAGERLPLIRSREWTPLVMHHHLAVARTAQHTNSNGGLQQTRPLSRSAQCGHTIGTAAYGMSQT
jgi:hypothetical protein